MPRKLKSYQTSIGFYDLAVAAPSMKAALDAWGADSNLFHQGVARETNDPELVAATLKHPGVVLKRAVGSNGRFGEHAALPRLSGGQVRSTSRPAACPKRKGAPKIDEATKRKAALQFEKEQKRREAQQIREDAKRARERERRQHAVTRAQGTYDSAEREHEKLVGKLRAQRDELESRISAEDARWESQKRKLAGAVRKAEG